MSNYIQFTGLIGEDQDLEWVSQTTIQADGTVSVTTPAAGEFDVDPNGDGKVTLDWDKIVEFNTEPAILLSVVQTSSGNGAQSTITVKTLETDQAEIQIVKQQGSNANRGFSFQVAGYAS